MATATSYASLGIALALITICLQGCDLFTNFWPTPPNQGHEPKCRELKFPVLDAEDGIVTETIAGKDAVVNCPPGHVYSGTNLMCGIVDKFCFAKSYEEIREANCHFQYEYVMAGSNIEFWPPKVRPELRDPSKDPEQELLEAHQLTTAAHLAAASAMMNLRKQELETLQRHQVATEKHKTQKRAVHKNRREGDKKGKAHKRGGHEKSAPPEKEAVPHHGKVTAPHTQAASSEPQPAPKATPAKVTPPKVAPAKVTAPKAAPAKGAPPKAAPAKVAPPEVEPTKVTPPKDTLPNDRRLYNEGNANPNPEGNPRALSQGGSGSDIVKRVLPHIVHIDELRCVPISGEDALVDKFGRLYSTEDAVFSEDDSIVNGLLVTIGIAAVSVVLFVMCAYRCRRRPAHLEYDLSEFGPETE